MTNAPVVPDLHPPAAKRGWYKRNEIAITPWLFLLPGILFFSAYVIIPIFQSFQVSLYRWDGLGDLSEQGQFIGLGNYLQTTAGAH